jgi:hypothetical protein
MYRRVMAFDFGSTLADLNPVPKEIIDARVQSDGADHLLFLTTGRTSHYISPESTQYGFRPIGIYGNSDAGTAWSARMQVMSSWRASLKGGTPRNHTKRPRSP